MNESAGESSTASQLPLTLQELLSCAELSHYYESLRGVLKLRNAKDLYYTDSEDLDAIGMSRPEQKRLFREYAKYFPEEKEQRKGFVDKMKWKVFGRSGKEENSRKSENGGIFARESGEGIADEQTQHIIPAERITLCKQIGSGEFGCVYQAAWYKDWPSGKATQVAVKRILPEKLISQPASFLQEAAIMTRMQHENVLRMFGVVLDTKAIMLVSELAPCGSLLECLQSPTQRVPFSISTLCDFALQIARGMKYLSSQRLIHRDLAARNVLVSSPSKVKISDFGLSRSLGHGEDYYRGHFSPAMKLPIAWCAPECINFLRFTSASDVWAYGVCLWEMFSQGRTPWANMTGTQILHAIDTQRRKLERPEACPADIYSQLIVRCWEWEAAQRPTFEQICNELSTLFPPLLVTVTECRNRRENHLQYEKGDTIVLLDKSTSYPGHWLGASKSGNVGLFRPEATIAYLGAENPSTASSGDICTTIPGSGGKSDTKKTAEKDHQTGRKSKLGKEKDKEPKTKGPANKKGTTKQQLEIGQPEGDLRHTCHVGADGRSFGLLSINKNDLPKSLPPLLPSPRGASETDEISPLLLMSTSTISLAPPRPPKCQSMDCLSRSVCLEDGASQLAALSPLPESCQTPPVLPPKPPRFRSRQNPAVSSAQSDWTGSPNGKVTGFGTSSFLLNEEEQKRKSTSPLPIRMNFETQEMQKVSDEMKSQKKEGEEEEEEFLRPASICLERLSPKVRMRGIEEENGQRDGGETASEEERILQILSGLQKDLSDFSVSTLDDYSEERPLLDREKRKEVLRNDHPAVSPSDHSFRTSLVVGMQPEEFEKRSEHERRRTNKMLGKMDQQANSTTTSLLMSHSPAAIRRFLAGTSETTAHQKLPEEELPRSKKEVMTSWSPEADQAYKLLVQCGHLLKGTPQCWDERTPSPKEPIPLTISNPMNGKTLAATSWEQPKKIEYLNSRLLDQAEEGQRLPSVEKYVNDQNAGRSPAASNGRGPPPPVPPKPRMRFDPHRINICATNGHLETNIRP